MVEFIQSYTILLFVSIVLSLTSLVVEYRFPVFENSFIRSLPKMVICRTMHYFIFLYSTTFLLWFDVQGFHAIIYLLFNLIMNIQWCMIQCCFLTYFELKSYGNVDYQQIPVNFHPFLRVFSGEYAPAVSNIAAVIIILSTLVILWFHRGLSVPIKILYWVIFTYSIYVCATGKNHVGEWLEYIITRDFEPKLETVTDTTNTTIQHIMQTLDARSSYPAEDHPLFRFFV